MVKRIKLKFQHCDTAKIEVQFVEGKGWHPVVIFDLGPLFAHAFESEITTFYDTPRRAFMAGLAWIERQDDLKEDTRTWLHERYQPSRRAAA
jgi:hypothetical protein